MSFFNFFKSNYTKLLEETNAELRFQNRILLDRVLLLATGAPLEIKQEEPLNEEERKSIRAAVDSASGDKPFLGTMPSFHDLLRSVEARTFHESAAAMTGYEEVQEGAEEENAQEEESDEERKARLLLRKHSQRAAANAQLEYLENTKPVDVRSR